MDSITQACVGAVVGEIALGKELGWRAPLWGAIVGSMPDMDIVAFPWLDDLERMRWHRGWSHALPGLILCAGIGAAWLHWRQHIAWLRCVLIATICVGVNILIDCFNVYGTQVFEPFSDYRVMGNLLFIIDPLFTGPLLLGLITCRSLRWKKDEWGQWAMLTGVILSCLYLSWAFLNKMRINSTFEDVLAHHQYEATRWMSTPTPFNTQYWRLLAEVPGGYVIAYASPGEDPESVPLVYMPHQHELMAEHMDKRAMQYFLWSCVDYWIARIDDQGRTVVTDIRFGDQWLGMPGKSSEVDEGIWSYYLDDTGSLPRTPRRVRDMDAALDFLWDRVMGNVGSEL